MEQDTTTKCIIDIDTNCYGLAITAAYKSNNEQLVDELVSDVKTNNKCKEALSDNHVIWHKILTAYGYLNNYHKIWYEYDEMKCYIKPDIVCFNILLSFVNDNVYGNELKLKILQEMMDNINNWEELKLTNYGELKNIHRIVVSVGDKEPIDLMTDILNSENRTDLEYTAPAMATFKYNGELYSFNNYYDNQENHKITKLVNKLIKTVKHELNVLNYPKISKDYATKLLSHHAEKKSLAFLLDKE